MAVAPLVPGALGQIVSGFMAFSAVMLLKCLLQQVGAGADESSPARWRRPTGKFTTPKRVATWS